ncbi:MAG: adenosylcobyric acid synthase [Myxococcota bacterium]|jgi:adenosylcobyric acid synthase
MTAIMIQGTGSDVGKSLVVAGLCRAFVRRGISVAPFKPQNMSNNAAITACGGEIGRAQALQARASRLEPTVDMNPVLLKPESDQGAQIVVQGRVFGHSNASTFGEHGPQLMTAVRQSFGRLRAQYDLVVVEGAGSASEVNLRDRDIANMGFAEAEQVPVVLLGDIDRGGVIASVVGTHTVISLSDRAHIVGYIINKFRGNVALFEPALDIIEGHTGWPSFGILPWLRDAALLPEEDATSARVRATLATENLRIAVPMLSRIANFDDLDPLAQHPGVDVSFVPPGDVLPECEVVVIPGTKNTRADLAFMRANGWDIDIAAHHRRGGEVVGLCGGYQMLGHQVDDPDGIEDVAGSSVGLGLLNVHSRLDARKTTRQMSGSDVRFGMPLTGYELHAGQTSGPDTERAVGRFAGHHEGATTADGRVWGTYLHGIFGNDDFRTSWLADRVQAAPQERRYALQVEDALDAIADSMETHLDIDGLLAAAG